MKDEYGREHTPPHFNPENCQLIFKAVEVGASVRDAANMVGCHESTIYKWLERGEDPECTDADYIEFAKGYRAAQSRKKLFHLQNITNAAKDGQWQASAWFLERVYPNEFAKTVRQPEDANVAVIEAIKGLMETMKSTADADA